MYIKVMAYNQQHRTRVIEYILEGHTHDEATDVFKAGTATIARWLLKYRKTGVIGGGTCQTRHEKNSI